MNDEREMLQLILPKIENIGDIEYKQKVKERQQELADQAKEDKKKADAAAAGGVDFEDDDEKQEEKKEEPVKLDFGGLKSKLALTAKSTVKTM